MWRRRKPSLDPGVADLAIRRLRDPNALIPADKINQVSVVAEGIKKAWALGTSELPSSGPLAVASVAKAAGSLPDLAGFQNVPQAVESAMRAHGFSWLGPFAPGAPLAPFVGYRVPPRTYDFMPGRNLEIEARDGRVPFNVLEQLFGAYDVAQICARYIINDLRSMELKFSPMDETTENVDKALAEAKKFWHRPDGKHLFPDWLGMYLYQVLSLDCGTLAIDRDGKKLALRVIDGKTIVPKVGWYGEVGGLGTGGEEELPSYQQVIEGVPWTDLTRQDIIYRPMWPRPDSVYGWPPMESVLLNGNTDLRIQAFFLQFFTSGAVPEKILVAPEAAGADAIERLQEVWDAVMSGDTSRRYGAVYVPGGTTALDNVLPVYPEALWQQIMRLTVASFNLLPVNLGMTEQVNRATAGTQMDLQERVGTDAYVRWLEPMFSDITQQLLGLPIDVEFDTGREKEDRLKEAQAWQIYINCGVASVDEPRSEVLGLPVDPAQMTPRFVVAGNAVVPLSQMMAVGGPVDPQTAAPTKTPSPQAFLWPGEQQPNPSAPALPPPSVAPPSLAPRTVAPANPVQEMPGTYAGAPSLNTTRAGAQGGRPAKKSAAVAGLLLVARDTGRVLMLQRAMTMPEIEPAAGQWEFPGGHVEPGETPWQAACREWEEEVGLPLPPVDRVGESVSPVGNYVAFVASVSHELDLKDRKQLNPESSGNFEQAQWWPVTWLLSHRGRRREVMEHAPLLAPLVHEALDQDRGVKASRELRQFRSVLANHLTHGDKQWRPFDFRYVAKGVATRLDAAAKAVDWSQRPTEWGPEALELEQRYLRSVADALARSVDNDQIRDAIQRYPLHVSQGPMPTASGPTVSPAPAVSSAPSSVLPAPATDVPAPMGDDLLDMWADGIAATVQVDHEPLRSALTDLAREATRLGSREASGLLTSHGIEPPEIPALGPLDAADPVSLTGGPLSASLVDDSTLLRALPAVSKWGTEIDDTTRKLIGSAIREGLRNGDSVGEIADEIESSVSSLGRAHSIVATECARYMTMAADVMYQRAGIDEVDFLAEATACPICRGIADTNPHARADLAIHPPIHPNCRCSLSPATTDPEQYDRDRAEAMNRQQLRDEREARRIAFEASRTPKKRPEKES